MKYTVTGLLLIVICVTGNAAENCVETFPGVCRLYAEGYGRKYTVCDDKLGKRIVFESCGWNPWIGATDLVERNAHHDFVHWELDALLLEGGVRWPRHWLTLGGGRARGTLTFNEVEQTDVDGSIFSIGGGASLDVCRDCPVDLELEGRHRRLADGDYFASEAEAEVRYVTEGRFSPAAGVRVTRGDARGLGLDKEELVAGVDIALTDRASTHVEASSDGKDTQWRFSLAWTFPRRTEDAAQTAITGPEQDCSSGIPVCRTEYVQPNTYTGVGSVNEVQGTCLQTEKNSVWYIFTVQTSGSLTFTINTVQDYDFALYDITANGCAGVPGSTPIRCNYSASGGQTGLVLPADPPLPPQGVSSSGSPFMHGVNVTAGQTYALLVTNFSGTNFGYTLTFGGTASIADTTAPTLASATIDAASCEIEIVTSEPIRCSSIDPTGDDFTVTTSAGTLSVTSAAGVGCGAFTNRIRLKYQSAEVDECGTWSIAVKTGGDGNTLVDNCGNALAPGSALTVATPPSASAALQMPSTFCEGTPVVANGSASTNEVRHFWEIVEVDASGTPTGEACQRWFEGPAGTFDLSQFGNGSGCPLQCGKRYRIKLAVQNCCTRWDEASEFITISCKPTADAGPDKSVCCCTPGKVQIGGPATAGYTYSWSPTTGLSDPTASNPTIDMSVFSDGTVVFPSTYTVTVTDAQGCTAKDSVFIRTVCACRPPANVTLTRPSACSPTYRLTADCACKDATPTYQWSNGATTQSIDVPGESGPYTVVCRNECGATQSAPVTVPTAPTLSGGFPPIQCPNIFTPNGDGINDLWTVTDLSLPVGATPAYNATEYELTIINRWGKTVAVLTGSTSTGFTNGSIPGWNGIATQSTTCPWWQWWCDEEDAGQPVSDGEYVYILRMRNCTTGWTDICHGWVAVVR